MCLHARWWCKSCRMSHSHQKWSFPWARYAWLDIPFQVHLPRGTSKAYKAENSLSASISKCLCSFVSEDWWSTVLYVNQQIHFCSVSGTRLVLKGSYGFLLCKLGTPRMRPAASGNQAHLNNQIRAQERKAYLDCWFCIYDLCLSIYHATSDDSRLKISTSSASTFWLKSHTQKRGLSFGICTVRFYGTSALVLVTICCNTLAIHIRRIWINIPIKIIDYYHSIPPI